MRRRRNSPVHVVVFRFGILDQTAWLQVLDEHIVQIRLFRCHGLELAVRNVSGLYFLSVHGRPIVALWRRAQHHTFIRVPKEIVLLHLPQRRRHYPLLLLHQRELVRLVRQFKGGICALVVLPIRCKPRPLLTVLPVIFCLPLFLLRSFHVRIRGRLPD